MIYECKIFNRVEYGNTQNIILYQQRSKFTNTYLTSYKYHEADYYDYVYNIIGTYLQLISIYQQ